MSVVERKTNTIMRSVGFEFNRPISSSDLNESQSIIIDNVLGFLGGKLESNTLRLTINEFTSSSTGITVTGIKFCAKDSSDHEFLGYISPNVVLTYPGTPEVGSGYDVYAYWRSVELTPESTVYLNGIRSNASQPSIVETTTTNNILDVNLNTEVSSRYGLELTFVVVESGSTAPTLDNWSTAVKVSELVITSDGVNISNLLNPVESSAADVGYDGTVSGLDSDNVQGAIDEISDEVKGKADYIDKKLASVHPSTKASTDLVTSNWSTKTWSGKTSFYGSYVWTDGENIYYSQGTNQYILDKSTSTWIAKIWTGLTNFDGSGVWTDGENTYYSYGSNQYILDKATSTWSAKTWSGLTSFYANNVWTDGDNIYYSSTPNHYILDKTTSTWSSKTWSGFTNFSGNPIWTDGENTYYSYGSNQYILDKATSTWSDKTWSGLTSFDGNNIWSDGDNIYLSNGTDQYVLNKSTSTWSTKTWSELTSFGGDNVWTDGDNIYYSNSASQYVLDRLEKPFELPSLDANVVAYNNANSGLDATNTQDAIDEVSTEVKGKADYVDKKVASVRTATDLSIDLVTSTWTAKTWTGRPNNHTGQNVWTDGDNIYYSANAQQYVLDKSTSTWSTKTWSGLTSFTGSNVWTDGDNIYYSNGTTHYVLNRATSTWSTKTWSELSSFSGLYVWTDGENIYYSGGSNQYILDKTTSTWTTKTWSGSMTGPNGNNIWTDGDNIYHSNGSGQYVLDKSTSTWSAKTWSGLTSFTGGNVWTDGDNIYYSNGTDQYVLDKSTSTWSTKTWNGLTSFTGSYVWTDGDNIYYSNSASQYVLDRLEKPFDLIDTRDAIAKINSELTASDNTKFEFTKSGNNYGYKDANGTFVPFKTVQASKTVTAGTSATTVTPDSGYDGVASVTVNPTPSQSKSVTATTSTQTVSPDSGKLLSSVTVNPTPSQSKSVTATTSAQTVSPDSGKLLSSVTVNPQVHSGTYAPTSFGTSLDMGASHNYRYVNTKNIPHRMGGIWCQIYYSSYESVVRWTVYGLGGFTGSSTLKSQAVLANGDNSVTVGGITLNVNYSTSTKKVSYTNTTLTNNTGVTLNVYPGFMFPLARDGYMSPQAGDPEQVANNSSINCYKFAPSMSPMASIDSSGEAHTIVVLVFTFEKVI